MPATLSSPPAGVAAGDVTTYAGALGEGPALQVALRVRAMVDRGYLVYMADETKHVVRVDTVTGTQRIIAGNGTYDGQGPDSLGDGGPAAFATPGYVSALTLDAAGNLYMADSFHFRIRKLEPSGRISSRGLRDRHLGRARCLGPLPPGVHLPLSDSFGSSSISPILTSLPRRPRGEDCGRSARPASAGRMAGYPDLVGTPRLAGRLRPPPAQARRLF